LPGEDGQIACRAERGCKIWVQGLTSNGKLVQVVRLSENSIMHGEEAFHGFLGCLLAMEKGISRKGRRSG